MLDILKDNNLANKTARDWFVWFWEPIVLLAEKALSCFLLGQLDEDYSDLAEITTLEKPKSINK